MRKLLLLFLLLTFVANHLQAQDRLFSQFYASPLLLNPALTGAFEGKYRVSAIYRDQWRNEAEKPFSTASTAFDTRWGMRHASRYKDYAAVGLVFLNDKTGALNFSTTQISISATYHKALDVGNTQVLSLGFQGGIVQRNINFGNVTFEDQFNGVNAYSAPTAERLPENNYAFGDYSVGLNYSYAPKSSRFRLFTGAAVHHFLSPSVSFFHRTDNDTELPQNNLDTRYSVQLNVQLPISARMALMPRIIFDAQGQHMRMDAGTGIRINTSDYKSIALHLGAFARPVADGEASYRLDAIVGMVGIELNNVLFGLSYDAYTGATAGFNRGSVEFSIAYLGDYEEDLILCPKF
jgi:type IX secretion system PorP/SprF family membrane protein